MKTFAVLIVFSCALSAAAAAQESPLVFAGGKGPARGKRVVLIAGDQEYRSEEAIPALAQILARHGFHCTVLFTVNPQTGRSDPNTLDNIPGLEALRGADLLVLFARFLELPDAQMKEIIDYANSGRPIVALRTSTHPFNYQKHPESPYAKYSYNSRQLAGGYGRQVLGETWINHYGAHQKQSTRGVIVPGMERHPILRGVHDLWGESDVYEIKSLFGDAQPLVMGQVLSTMDPNSEPDPAKKLTPVAWTKTYTGESGKPDLIFTTTMGHVGDFRNDGFRRMVVNACYWAVGLEKKISATSSVEFAAPFEPHPIGVRRVTP
jgi:Trehalose utilisation